jgi:hypothetical protein
MQINRIAMVALALSAIVFAVSAQAIPETTTTLNFAIMRNGAQIGTNLIQIGHDGADTTVQQVTHVNVGFAFLTFYKFDQTESERWAKGKLLAMTSTTDDNGTVHQATATARNGILVVRCNGKVSETASTTMPYSLWNPALVEQTVALDTRNGGLEAIKAIDDGEQNVLVQGRWRRAHHYQIVTNLPQDVWYDDSGDLVQVEMKGTDGSTITYTLV